MTLKKLKIVLLGSGGLSIGQAGEFDYSGTQALRTFLREGIEVLLVNPNVASVQTSPRENLKIFLCPVEPQWVEEILKEHKPDGIVAGFGGQTALNCLLKLELSGALNKYGVKNFGTSATTLKMTEDRKLFAAKMTEIGMPIAPSISISNVEDSLRAALEIGYPVILRAAYTLGGLGSGFAHNSDELKSLVESSLASGPQVLIEKSLRGWKEIEYEVMRDSSDNAIAICNLENIDPLGIHTGDSVVVAPSQTLSDGEYQLLRNAALKIVRALNVIGECNVQFALDPHSRRFYVIEVNARLSRSSALASKATGYPIASIAAQVVLGKSLLDIKNPVTKTTSAFHEPALDYVTIKIPKWDMAKFRGASQELGPSMKSVGEVMAIGRSFEEAFQKAVRMVFERPAGISGRRASRAQNPELLKKQLTNPTHLRLFALMDALKCGITTEEIHQLTGIDKWFLSKFLRIIQIERQIESLGRCHLSKKITTPRGSPEAPQFFIPEELRQIIKKIFGSVSDETWFQWKRAGFGDQQIAALAFPETLQHTTLQASIVIRNIREGLGVRPIIRRIDTTSGEHPSQTNYLFLTYSGSESDTVYKEQSSKDLTVIILGGGPYRVGSSVEFDWSTVECSDELRKNGFQTVIINCNPETVSTDFDESDRLYFEELTVERILDIAAQEKPLGVVVCMGGQAPNSLAEPLSNLGIKILGHSATDIDAVEDRSKFSQRLEKIKIHQPQWAVATSTETIQEFVDKVNFPILVRPSYVLSGSGMDVAWSQKTLANFVKGAAIISDQYPVVISQFLDDAREIEVDGVAMKGDILASILSEHVENAGTHSGDATVIVPASGVSSEMSSEILACAKKIVREFNLNGPFNIQMLLQENDLKIIECNARVSRSFPFVSKVTGTNLARLAARVLMGLDCEVSSSQTSKIIGVKAPLFSFNRLIGVDPLLGVEMMSTGEVGCIAYRLDEAFILAMESCGLVPPKKGILVSAGSSRDKNKFLECAVFFRDIGLPVYATPGTADFLIQNGFQVHRVEWPSEKEPSGGAVSVIKNKLVDLVFNIPKEMGERELVQCALIRKSAVAFSCPVITDINKMLLWLHSIKSVPQDFKTRAPSQLMGPMGK